MHLHIYVYMKKIDGCNMSQYWHPWVLRFEPASVRDRLSQVQETSQIRLGKNVRLMQKPWNSQVDLPD